MWLNNDALIAFGHISYSYIQNRQRMSISEITFMLSIIYSNYDGFTKYNRINIYFLNLPHTVKILWNWDWGNKNTKYFCVFVCDFSMRTKDFENCLCDGVRDGGMGKLIGILIIYEKRNFIENGWERKVNCKNKKQSSIFTSFVSNWNIFFKKIHNKKFFWNFQKFLKWIDLCQNILLLIASISWMIWRRIQFKVNSYEKRHSQEEKTSHNKCSSCITINKTVQILLFSYVYVNTLPYYLFVHIRVQRNFPSSSLKRYYKS